MNQGKLEVVKLKMESVNIDFEEPVHWNGLERTNLIQMTIISTTVGRNPSKEME